ncbi:MAG: DNA polymerase III subunit gamma/tau [Lachnospiraceae bacterium]|nr:DNA polymerase III subunit gamma/tau [Lachnospiraceae bacterium]
MAYTALYRKFRPDNFEDVKGQSHIVTTLQNQIKAERMGHAYLFCGTRGTGKTSIAKIFARAVNCEHPVNGSPCNECAVCRSINAGTSMNVIEIDAASNNGVDNIREIVEEVQYSPAEGKYKVYIIDEVHMLSIGAFNALLKTLEEPPSYVIFILATTEVHKIPITILSRCQRYDFKRITIETIASRLEDLMKTEQIEVEEKAIRYIAKAADGSMRDALSLLDQCIAFYLGKTLTYDNVLEVLGAVDTEVFSRFLRRILDEDIVGLMKMLEELVMQGRELGQFVIDFTWYLRNLLLISTSDNMEDVLDISSENLARLKEEATMVDQDRLMRYIRVFSELSGQIKYAVQKRIFIEIALIKLCKPAMENNLESVIDRITKLEEKLEKGDFVSTKPVSYAQPEPQPVTAPDLPLPKAIPEEVKQVVENWPAIIRNTSKTVQTFLKNAKLSLAGDNRLLIVFKDDLAFGFVGNENHKDELQKQISDYIGKEIEIEIRLLDEGSRFEETYVNIEQAINMEITIEDDNKEEF